MRSTQIRLDQTASRSRSNRVVEEEDCLPSATDASRPWSLRQSSSPPSCDRCSYPRHTCCVWRQRLQVGHDSDVPDERDPFGLSSSPPCAHACARPPRRHAPMHAGVRAHAILLMAGVAPRLDRSEADKAISTLTQVTRALLHLFPN